MVRAGKAPAGGGSAMFAPCPRHARATRAMRRRQTEEWLLDLASSAELTPLFQALGLESHAALACTAKAWQRAIEDFSAAEPRIPVAHKSRRKLRLDPAQFVKRVLPRYVNLQHLNINAFHGMEQAEIGAVGTQISAPGLTALLGIALLTQLHVTSSSRLSQEAIEAARERHPNVGGRFRSNHINLKVVTQAAHFSNLVDEIYFKMLTSSPLRKLMHAFCNRQGVTMGSVWFVFDGNRINETQTPGQLEMEDGDVIDVMVAQ